MYNSESEARDLINCLIRIADTPEEIRINMVRIFLDGAYFRGKIAGLWLMKPNNVLKTSEADPDTYEIRKNSDCEDEKSGESEGVPSSGRVSHT